MFTLSWSSCLAGVAVSPTGACVAHNLANLHNDVIGPPTPHTLLVASDSFSSLCHWQVAAAAPTWRCWVDEWRSIVLLAFKQHVGGVGPRPVSVFWQVQSVAIRTRLATLKGYVFTATQLNSAQLNWPSWTAYSQVSRVFVYDVTTYKLSQLLLTLSSWVQLSSVELSRVVSL